MWEHPRAAADGSEVVGAEGSSEDSWELDGGSGSDSHEKPDAEMRLVTTFERPFVAMGPVLPPRPLWMLDESIVRTQLGLPKLEPQAPKCPIFGGPTAPKVSTPFRVHVFSDEENWKHLESLRAGNPYGRLPRAEQEVLDEQTEKLWFHGMYWGVSGERPGHMHADDLIKMVSPARSFLVTTVVRGETKTKIEEIEQRTAKGPGEEARYGVQLLPSVVENHLRAIAGGPLAGLGEALADAEAEEGEAEAEAEAPEAEGGYVEAEEAFDADPLALCEGPEWAAAAAAEPGALFCEL